VMAPDVVEHLFTCEDCRNLITLLGEGGKSAGAAERQLEHIRSRIVENLRPVRPLPHSRFLLFACATIFLCIVTIGAAPYGMNGWSALSIGQKVAVFTALTDSVVLLAISMVGQMVPGSRYALAPALLPISIVGILLVVIAATFQSRAEPAFLANGVTCMINGLTYSIPAALLFWLFVRLGAMLNPKSMGAAAGGLAGLVGLSVLEINCANLNVFHILVWHWGVVLINSTAGALLGFGVEYTEAGRTRNVY
jgi:hypothetical protein